LYGIKTNTSGANGVILAFFLKLAVVAYVIAYHKYGFRIPDLPALPDFSVLTQLL